MLFVAIPAYAVKIPRREASRALFGVAAAATTLPLVPTVALAAAAAPAAPALLRASWTATDGFDDAAFISFDEGAYAAMRDDERRTPLFEKAIAKRIAAAPADTLTVLDIGTGPYALLALAAYRAGAKKVYTVEASKEAAKRARAVLQKEGIPSSKVEVLEGFSTSISLPEKVDLLVAEIAGSVGSEEGAYATVRDAQARLLKAPSDPRSYIPYSIETLAAPASYALHYALGPPRFDWAKLKEPVRLNCRDQTLELLADPLVLETIRFADPALPASGVLQQPAPLTWNIDPTRVSANEKVFFDELTREGAKEAEATLTSSAAARSVSGLAMWPRLVLDPEGTLVVESRGPKGEAQKSHWQTVLPLMSARPARIEPRQAFRASLEVDLRDGKPNTPLKYTLTGEIVAAEEVAEVAAQVAAAPPAKAEEAEPSPDELLLRKQRELEALKARLAEMGA